MRNTSIVRFMAINFFFIAVSNFIHPVTPLLLQRIGCPDYMFGVAFAAMSTTFFLTCPFWGRMGDQYGYIKILSIGIIGYAVGQLIFSTAANSYMVVLGRAVSGMFISATSVCGMAFLSKSTDDAQKRAQYMAIYAAVSAISTAVGFLVGGVVGDGSIEIVFVMQVVGILLSAVLFYFLMGEIQPILDKKKITFVDVNPISSILVASKMITAPMATFLLAAFLTSFATNAHDTSFNYFLRAQLAFPPSGNGIFKSVVGIIGLVANFSINMWIARKTDTRKSIIAVLALCGASLVLMVNLPSVTAFLISAMIFYGFNSIYLPIQQSLIVKNDSGISMGTVAGIFNAARALGMIIGPLVSGFAYATSPKLPFIAAAIAFFAATAISYINYKQYSRLDKKVRQSS